MNELEVITYSKCAPSGLLKSTLSKLEKELKERSIIVKYLDLKKDFAIIQDDIKGTPCMTLNSQHVKIGAPNPEQLLEWLDYHLTK